MITAVSAIKTVTARAPQIENNDIKLKVSSQLQNHSHFSGVKYRVISDFMVDISSLPKYFKAAGLTYRLKNKVDAASKFERLFIYSVSGLKVYDNIRKELVDFVGQAVIDLSKDTCNTSVSRMDNDRSMVYVNDARQTSKPSHLSDDIYASFILVSKSIESEQAESIISISKDKFFEAVMQDTMHYLCSCAAHCIKPRQHALKRRQKVQENEDKFPNLPRTLMILGFMFKKRRNVADGYVYVSSQYDSESNKIHQFRFDFETKHPALIDFYKKSPDKTAFSIDNHDGRDDKLSYGGTHTPIHLKKPNPDLKTVIKIIKVSMIKYLTMRMKKTKATELKRYKDSIPASQVETMK